MGVAEAIIVSSLIGGGISMIQGEKQRQATSDAEGKAAWRAQQQKDELARQQQAEKEQQALIRTRDAQAMRMKVATLGAQGRAGTILTGPQGLGTSGAPAPGAGGKTLLGS